VLSVYNSLVSQAEGTAVCIR